MILGIANYYSLMIAMMLAGNAVLYLAMDIDNKIVFSFTSRCIFVNWFKYIPITFTDRNHYKSIIDKEPLFANVPALIDFQ